MNTDVTVEQAIARGNKMVNNPTLCILILVPVAFMLLYYYDVFSAWIIAVGFVLGFLLAWLYWSVMITRWRLWAFENVRNVHELRKKAIKEKLMWPEGSMFEKTEIRSAPEKEKWKALQQKFELPDEFKDDLSIPAETIIYVSKNKSLTSVVIITLLFALGIYQLVFTENYLIGLALAVLGVIAGSKEFMKVGKAVSNEPQIILNEQGMQTVNAQFYEWSQIVNEDLILEGGKHKSWYLTYTCPSGSEKLDISDLTTKAKEMEKLMKVYRGRFTQKNPAAKAAEESEEF
jgi:uncharacterized membrane protein YciS (DUF1049 family)